MLQKAKERISSGEVNFPLLFVKKIQTFLGNDEGGAYYSKDFLSNLIYTLCVIASNIWYYFVVMLAAKGIVRIWREKSDSILYIVPMYVLGLTLAHMLVEVAGRYHYSIIPMLVIVAAFSIKDMKKTHTV